MVKHDARGIKVRGDKDAMRVAIPRPTGDQGQTWVGGWLQISGIERPLGRAGVLLGRDFHLVDQIGVADVVFPDVHRLAAFEQIEIAEDGALHIVVPT